MVDCFSLFKYIEIRNIQTIYCWYIFKSCTRICCQRSYTGFVVANALKMICIIFVLNFNIHKLVVWKLTQSI